MSQMPGKFTDPIPTAQAVPGHGHRAAEGGGAGAKLIPYRNPKALIGYYLSIASLLPIIGLLTGPIAAILGILGYSAYRRDPSIHGQVHAIIALVLGTLCFLFYGGIAALIVVGMLAG
ncbi:MAG TPA: hypothetical protein DCQ98_02620 [Planctomycetaceae bacterium]|nr:hypothetical protein [Planctomycetaceae bacterium]HRE99845.1 hypothetical protein [Pirellulaceae bacterium]